MYFGETLISGYERGLKHTKDYVNLDEDSHLLKHYLIAHRDIRMEDLKIGMRMKSSFNSAIERQVAEAVSTDFEKRKGKMSINSKSQYN